LPRAAAPVLAVARSLGKGSAPLPPRAAPHPPTHKKTKPRSRRADHALPEKAGKLHSHTVALRNLTPPEIARELWWLASSQGRPQSSRIPVRHVVSKRPSIQGAWSAGTFAQQGAR
jgi:hypothetical protein